MIVSRKLILSFLIVSFTAVASYADVFNQEIFKTHYRWNFSLVKDQIKVTKKDNLVLIETLDLTLFETLAGDIAKQNPDVNYIEKVEYIKDNFPAQPAQIKVYLKNNSVELFSFYRDEEKKYILDYWINSDLITEKSAGFKKPLAAPIPVVQKNPIPMELKKPKKSILEVIPVQNTQAIQNNPGFRDFRYGAAFFWNYQPLLPPIEKDINLQSKIPEYLYPIKDRANIDDPREAHLQLSINLYRKEKYGLMNKSITLYEKKYGKQKDAEINEYLKVNALLKSNLSKGDRTIQMTAINMLSHIIGKTNDYEMKRGLYRYMMQFYVDQKDFIKTLDIAKSLFVEARGEFDHEVVIVASGVILHTLAQLKQSQKIQEFLADKKLISILPPQIGHAYMSYSLLLEGKTSEIVKEYELKKKSLVKPVHPAILFNVAESYFREAQFQKAIEVFDEFVADHSQMIFAAYARLRMGLCYDLLDKPIKETLVLYKNTIDRSNLPDVRYEAKLRYVGVRLARNEKITPQDFETEIFLEQSPDEARAIQMDLKKLLWLVRLRIFINQRHYEKALTYLSSIPLDTFKPAEKRVFEGDGAEIVFGLIQKDYLDEEYAKAVKVWEVYRLRYETKIAKNPYLNFLVADSYIKLGLLKSYDRALADLETAQPVSREFPEWIPRPNDMPLADYMEELALIKLIESQDWVNARAKLSTYPVSLRDSPRTAFYRGQVEYASAKYLEASQEFEKVLINQAPQPKLTPRQMADLLMSYVESLYHLKDIERFKTVVTALVEDIKNSKSASILNISERVQYLMIESLASEDKMDFAQIELLTKTFKKNFQKSPYISRIEYLLGVSLVRSDKVKEGSDVLNSLISEKGTPGYIKEMAKTELSALALKNRKL